MNPSAIRLMTTGLSPDEVQEMVDIATYLGEKAGPGNSGYLPEGSVASLLNRASPKVREKFSRLNETMETPRHVPYASKRSEGEIAADFGFDPDVATTAKAALDGQFVATQLQQRMGTDSSRPDEQPSLRDMISAAADHHEKGDSNA